MSYFHSIRRNNHLKSIARAEEGKTHRVVRVQKNGKRVACADIYGVKLFDEDRANALCTHLSTLNPTQKFEVEKA